MSVSIGTAKQSLDQTFALLRERGRIGVLPFLPAGYPDLPTTVALLPALQSAGASAIEIGFPFSDPIADGPVIQAAFADALSRKITVDQIFAAIQSLNGSISIPLLAMVSYSIVFRYGLQRFIQRAKAAGFSGLIVPDLPPPEAEKISREINAGGLDTILLVAPTTSVHRREQIARLCTGFVYYLSVTGITGERSSLPADLQRNLAELRKQTDRPICVGFGISKASHVVQLVGHAQGTIVGTAFVRVIQQSAPLGTQAVVEAAAAFCRSLLPVE